MLQPPSYHKLCHFICSGHTVTCPIDPYRSSLCSGPLLSSPQPFSHSCREKKPGLKDRMTLKATQSIGGGGVQNASILSSSCLSLTHFPNPPDLLDTQDVYLRHGFASLRCCFKFHVCNSKRQREMGNLSPRNHSPTPAKWKMLLARGCSCRTNCV